MARDDVVSMIWRDVVVNRGGDCLGFADVKAGKMLAMSSSIPSLNCS